MRSARHALCLFVVLIVLSALAPVMGQNASCGEYVIASGDTLFRIAQAYGLTVNELAAANNIADPSTIFAGQRLTIPCAGDSIQAAPHAAPWPTLSPITIQTVSQIGPLYHRILDTTPVGLGVAYEMNNPNGYGQMAILDDQGTISQIMLGIPDNVTSTIGGAGDQYVYQMAMSNVDGAVGAAQYDPNTSSTVIRFSNLFGDPNAKLDIPIPPEDGLSVSDFAMQSGLFIRTVGDITGGPNPDTKPGVIFGNLMEGFAGDPFIVHEAPVVGVRLSPDSSLVATITIDGALHVWDISSFGSAVEAGTTVAVATLQIDAAKIGLSSKGNVLALAPDNAQLAYGDNAGNVLLWNYRTDVTHTFEAFPGSAIQHVAFNGDGSILAVSAGVLPGEGDIPATQDSSIQLFDVLTLANGIADPRITALTGPTQTVAGLAFGPNDQLLIAVAADRTLWAWGVDANAAVQPQPVVVPTTVAIAPTIPAPDCSRTFFLPQATGCAQSPAITTSAVYQGFQNGFMLWLGDSKSILVLYNNGSVGYYMDDWAGQQVITNSAPPAGTLQPDHGFGWVWTQQPGVKDAIGWATGVEVAYTMTYQVGRVDSPGPRPPGLNYYTLPDGVGTPIQVEFGDGGGSWLYVS